MVSSDYVKMKVQAYTDFLRVYIDLFFKKSNASIKKKFYAQQ